MKFFFLIISTLLLSVGITGCEQGSEKIFSLPQSETITLKSEMVTPFLALTGIIEAQKSIFLSSKIAGRLDILLVEIGDVVSADTVVAKFSAFNDQTQIAYNNALSQLTTTKISSQSTVQSANVALMNAQQQHDQNQRQEQANIHQLLDTLNARTSSAHTTVERILSFLDMTMGASPKFKYGTNSSVISAIGSNDSIGRQQTKNEIATIIRANENQKSPASSDSIRNARQEISLLKQIQTVVQSFYTLIRNTPATSQFSESQRQVVQLTTEKSLNEISDEILALETQMSATITAQEQLGLGIIQTQNAIENAEAQLQMAEANSGQRVQLAMNQIVSAKNMQNELNLKAPFDGIITQRFVDEGALIAPGKPIFELADRSILKIQTEIPDNYIGKIAEQMVVEIKIDGLTKNFSGKITRINPAVNSRTRTLGIEITLEESPDQIRIGMFARIKVVLEEKLAFFVPKRFIKAQFSGTFITTTNNDSLAIQLGEEKDGQVEIISSELKEGMVLTSSK
jgi:RND family efflux transporter MFP subunit